MIRRKSRHWWFSLLCLAACTGGDQPDREADASTVEQAVPQDVREELVELGVQDQAVRQDLSPEKVQDSVFVTTMMSGDSARTMRLREIVEQYGWPDTLRAGPQAANAAFLILQHSPSHDFQKQLAPTIEDLARKGSVPRSDAAMLVDRVLMYDSLPQRYGTQFKLQDGRMALHPVEDEARLEQLRAEMELPTMAEYMKMLEEFYKIPAVRQR